MNSNRCCLCSYEALDGDHLEDHIVQTHSNIFKNEANNLANKSSNGEQWLQAFKALPWMAA
jgi:hypothetical protein